MNTVAKEIDVGNGGIFGKYKPNRLRRRHRPVGTRNRSDNRHRHYLRVDDPVSEVYMHTCIDAYA